MGWFKKKSDPISARARLLNDEIADLEAEIRRLGESLKDDDGKANGTVQSRNPGGTGPAPQGSARIPAAVPDPIFEQFDQHALKARGENTTTPEHYNELGVRKYDLPALLLRWRNHFRGPSTTNPKLVSYLAAGGIQGLRPMRYEKRVARNRFIALIIFLFLILLGTVAALVRRS